MPASTLRTGLRAAIAVTIVGLLILSVGERGPVPFNALILVLCGAGVLTFLWAGSIGREQALVPQQALVETENRLEEFARLNAELSRELLESRVFEEAQLLQARAFDAFIQGVCITDPYTAGNPIVYVNDGFVRLTGFSRDESIGRNCRLLQGRETSPDSLDKIREAIRQQKPCFVEILNYRKDGSPFWNALSIAPIFEDGRLTHFVGVQTDISAFKNMEQQLRQSQKMEAIGHLAGGVAHDFNNLLTVINGCCELLRADGPLPQTIGGLVDEIHKAGERAATLTRQLLAFSRKTVLQPRVLSINDLVTDCERLLGRLIREDIRFATSLAPATGLVRVDPGQMEQVLMNLVVNARDAMPLGGRLTIETYDVSFAPGQSRPHAELAAGRYVMVAVADTGCGMDKVTLGRMFEPFFTTKPVGKGTGLGLAMVYGIVKASGGHVTVTSELGRGTTFKLYIPVVDEAVRTPTPASRSGLPGGTETVLIVEDEDGVRSVARQALQAHGYNVLEAADGVAALDLCRDHDGEIDLILSDVVMPRMGGRELTESIGDLYPDMKVLFTSGHTDDAVVRHGVREAGSDFLQKPFTITALLKKVRNTLDRADCPEVRDEVLASASAV